MIVQIKRIILLLWIFYLPGQAVFSQSHSSKNNYTGDWEIPASWNPTWTVPQTNISGYNITINGYITLNDSLSFTGASGNLIINDTIVIIGDLFIDNNNTLTVNDNGILIVRGNLTIHNHANIIANGYLIITGDFDKHGPNHEGSLTSNDDPVKVFIGGAISPGDLTDNEPDYLALNCTSPTTIPYPNSACSYGNMTDIENDPIYPFFQHTCTITNVNSNSPVCTGNTIDLTSTGGTGYSWSGPNGFTSSAQNPSIPNADTAMEGAYAVTVTAAIGCMVKDTTNVTVNALPIATAGSNSPICMENTINLTSTGGIGYSWSGPNSFTSSAQNSMIFDANIAMAGAYTVTITDANGCMDTDTINIIVNALPLVNITSSSSSMCINDLRTLTGSPPGGMFILSDGPGTITGNVLSVTGIGNIDIEYNYIGVCANKTTQSINVNENPIAIAGPDQELKFVFETQMKAELSSSETGEWSLISGSGHVNDIHSPTTRITELPIGESIFLWKVRNGNCEASAEVKITVYDLFAPSVITPNDDGKNDYFMISEIIGQVELIIFNRWGNEEYTNSNYLNDWNGRNNKGVELPNDTYFYILKFENNKINKGSVLIKR